MKDPTRLLDLPSELAEPGRALLRAAASEEPPEGALERLLGVLPAPAAPAADRHLSGIRPALRAGAAGARRGLRWPLLAGGAVSLVAAAWIAARTLAPAGSGDRAAGARPATADRPSSLAAEPVQTARPITGPERSAAPPPAAAVDPPTAGGSAASETGSRPRSLAQEIASLDHVRKLLAAGDPAQALRALRRHARSYPQGALLQEAELLQIEALTRAGEPARARTRALQFLSQHPDSPHAARVRGLLAGADGAP
jgi:hypothetical protein